MQYDRTLKLAEWIKHRSIFLIGPRQTGKSSLLKSLFPQSTYIDLLESDTFRLLASHPERLRDFVPAGHVGVVIIDEIQKLPEILDEVQRLIDRHKMLRFVLTGSSARKLRRGNANLLGGRALFLNLHPLTSHEVGTSRISDLITRGGLPGIIDSPIYWEDLKAYVGAYLREEIQAEGLTRNIGNFSRFLDTAIFFNAQQVNYTKIGNDAQISPRTIRDYVSILTDTMIAHLLPPFSSGRGRKTVSIEKMYFFDIGVANMLSGRKSMSPLSPEYGVCFEHLVFLELRSYLSYQRVETALTYWRTESKLEVDFVLGDSIAIEAKSGANIGPSDLKGLRALKEERRLKRAIVVSHEMNPRKTEDGIEILPIANFLEELWAGGILPQ